MAAETFEIALKSNVAAVAAKDAAALDALIASANKASAANQKINAGKSAELAQVKAVSAEMAQQAALAAKLATFDASRAKAAADLRSKLKALTDEATGKAAADARKAKIADVSGAAGAGKKIDKILGIDEAKGFEQLAADLGPAGVAAGGAIAAGGAVVLAAAAALAVAAGKLIVAAVEYGIEQTKAAQRQKEILDKLTGGRGKVTFDLALSLAGETGQTPEVTIERVKQLMAAKFSESEIPLLIKASADLGAVKGEEKGKQLLEQLEIIANKGKVSEESLNAVASAGANANVVLEKLRKKGESLDAVRLRLKGGTIDAKEFARAVGEAVEQDFGGVAGKGLDASINRLKIGVQKIFQGLNLAPLTTAIDKAAKVLDGPAGEKLKAAFSHLGDAALKTLFGPFEGAEGQKRLEKIATTLATVVEKTAVILEKAAPIIEKALDLLFDTGKKDPSALGAVIDVLLGMAIAVDSLVKLDFEGVAAGLDRIAQAIAGLLGVDISPAASIGTGIIDGMVGGIVSGASSVVAAIQTVAGDAISAAKSALGIASPSKVFADLGSYTALGFAKGANDNAGVASEATASMAADATGSAAGAMAGSAPGVGGGGIGPITIGPIVVNGGGTADQQASAIADALEPKVLAIMRKAQRNMGEQGANLTTRAA